MAAIITDADIAMLKTKNNTAITVLMIALLLLKAAQKEGLHSGRAYAEVLCDLKDIVFENIFFIPPLNFIVLILHKTLMKINSIYLQIFICRLSAIYS